MNTITIHTQPTEFTELIKCSRPYYNVTFNRDGCEIVGRLSWDDGTLHFEGNADESARMLFEWVKQIIDPYIAEKLDRAKKIESCAKEVIRVYEKGRYCNEEYNSCEYLDNLAYSLKEE